MKKTLLTLLTLMTPHVSALHDTLVVTNTPEESAVLLQQVESATFQMEEIAGLIDIGAEILQRNRAALAQLSTIVRSFQRPHNPQLVAQANDLENRLRKIPGRVITGLVDATREYHSQVLVYESLPQEIQQEFIRNLSFCDKVLNALGTVPLTAVEQAKINVAKASLSDTRISLLKLKVQKMEALIDTERPQIAQKAIAILQPVLTYLAALRQNLPSSGPLSPLWEIENRRLGDLENRIMVVTSIAILKLDFWTNRLAILLPRFGQMDHEEQNTYITELNLCDNIYNTLVTAGAIFTPEQQQRITSVQNRITMIRNSLVGTAS